MVQKKIAYSLLVMEAMTKKMAPKGVKRTSAPSNFFT